jgi:hypothetical protein
MRFSPAVVLWATKRTSRQRAPTVAATIGFALVSHFWACRRVESRDRVTMKSVFARRRKVQAVVLPHAMSVVMFAIVSITVFMAYSLQAYATIARPASACFTLREEIEALVDRVAAGDYNISSDRLAEKPFSDVNERDVIGEWRVADGSGSEFIIDLEPGFTFSCRRKDRSDVQLSGLYHFGRNDRTGQIALRFEARQVHAEGTARTLFPGPHTYLSIIERIAMHEMVAPALHVQRTQDEFVYGLTSAPVTWKRGGDHAACADLRRLKAEYDEVAHGRFQAFKVTEKDTLEALWRIAVYIEAEKQKIEERERDFRLDEAQDAAGVGAIFPAPLPVMGANALFNIYIFLLKQEARRYISDRDKIEFQELLDEEWALISDFVLEQDGAHMCAQFLADYSFLKDSLRCD